ncbi:MAG: ABC transporter ATP-binding protein [Lentisphaerota bacterium]
MNSKTGNPDAVIASSDIVKTFRDFWRRPRVQAVRGVSFEVNQGEVFGLLGPNGSGKSTIIKMILGLLHPTTGHLRVLGQSPRDIKTKARVGYLPEESYIYPYLTPDETLGFYGSLFDLDARTRRERTEQLLDMVGLLHTRNRAVGEFSKGMARRVGLAQALINDPDLIVLDEPTSGLDPQGCRQIKDLILTLARRGKTVLLSSHLLADVEDVCDRIAILYNGRIQAQGSIRVLLEEKDRFRITLPGNPKLDMQKILQTLREIIGQEPDVDHPRRNLEQYFLDVIEKAKKDATESSGAAPSGRVAEYLSEAEHPS